MPTPTPEPPTPTPTPTIYPVEIALTNPYEEQVGGAINYTGQLKIRDLGMGDLQLTAPNRIKLEESGTVRLIITPDSALATCAVFVDMTPEREPRYVISIDDRIQVYSVMIAELEGVNFEIDPSGPRIGDQLIRIRQVFLLLLSLW